MWPRKRIDIDWSDLLYGLVKCVIPASRDTAVRKAEAAWSQDDRAFACLSVRSGLDICLRALNLPAGSEILCSAINLGDMVRIVEHHGLVVVPVDLNWSDSSIQTDDLNQRVTDKTRAILVAQLLGTRIDLAPVVEFAERHELLVLEDCAQAFEGRRYRGCDAVDVSMFSFGPIKTATALSGAMFRVRDESLRQRMIEIQATFPLQSKLAYFRRILFYCVLKFLGIRFVFGIFVRCCRLMGKTLDEVLNNSVNNFSAHAFFDNLRHQPCEPLLSLMRRRILTYPERLLDERSQLGSLVSREVGLHKCPGGKAKHHTHWLAPILVKDPRAVIEQLHRAGFDATDDNSLEVAVPTEDDSTSTATTTAVAVSMLQGLIYVPIYPGMPEKEVRRMSQIIKDH